MKKISILLVFFVMILPSMGWGGTVDGKGLWCNVENENLQPFHYWSYFFEDGEVIEYRFEQNNDLITLIPNNLGKYSTTEGSIRWVWRNYAVVLDRKTLVVKYLGLSTTYDRCEVFSKKSWNMKKDKMQRYYQMRYDKKQIGNKI